jgi:glyoxylase I family protein
MRDNTAPISSSKAGCHSLAGQIPTGEIHHLRLTVTDLERSRPFYTGLLGFQVAVESPPPGDPSAAETFKILFGGIVMTRGTLLMGLRPMAPSGDRSDPDRVGLDHLSFGVASHGDLEEAVRLFDERGAVGAVGAATRILMHSLAYSIEGLMIAKLACVISL